jgi:DNA-directed RNA polymerase subunit L
MSTTLTTKPSIQRLQHTYLAPLAKLVGVNLEVNDTNLLPIRLSGVDLCLANALRRIIIAEIPTLAFANADIQILQNTSEYHREVVLDRIGFITLSIAGIQRISPAGLQDLRFTLCDPDVNSDPFVNRSGDFLEIFIHQHLKVFVGEKEVDIKDVCPHNSLLFTLKPRQMIHIVARPTWGSKHSSPTHTRWQAGLCTFKYATERDFKQSDDHETNDDMRKVMSSGITATSDIRDFILTIESFGKMPSNQMLSKSIDLLKAKLKMFSQQLTQSTADADLDTETPDSLRIKYTPNQVKIEIPNEGHTLGAILDTYGLRVLTELVDPELFPYCLSGYRQPNPLSNHVELTIKVPAHDDFKTTPVEVLQQAIKLALQDCETLSASWK